jgi:hypothetical protein
MNTYISLFSLSMGIVGLIILLFLYKKKQNYKNLFQKKYSMLLNKNKVPVIFLVFLEIYIFYFLFVF